MTNEVTALNVHRIGSEVILTQGHTSFPVRVTQVCIKGDSHVVYEVAWLGPDQTYRECWVPAFMLRPRPDDSYLSVCWIHSLQCKL